MESLGKLSHPVVEEMKLKRRLDALDVRRCACAGGLCFTTYGLLSGLAWYSFRGYTSGWLRGPYLTAFLGMGEELRSFCLLKFAQANSIKVNLFATKECEFAEALLLSSILWNSMNAFWCRGIPWGPSFPMCSRPLVWTCSNSSQTLSSKKPNDKVWQNSEARLCLCPPIWSRFCFSISFSLCWPWLTVPILIILIQMLNPQISPGLIHLTFFQSLGQFDVSRHIKHPGTGSDNHSLENELRAKGAILKFPVGFP